MEAGLSDHVWGIDEIGLRPVEIARRGHRDPKRTPALIASNSMDDDWPTSPPPGPDGMPHLLRLPDPPEVPDRDCPWLVEVREHPHKPEWWAVLVHASGAAYYPPSEAPAFEDIEECRAAAWRAAIRLGTLVREK